jgi:hypothetical protein
MINIQTNILNDNDHGLIGLGTIKYSYEYGEGSKLLTLTSKKFNKTIEYKGDEAEVIYNRFISDGKSSIINHVKRLAAEACQISMFRLHEDTRQEEIVYARYLIFYYLNTYENLSYQKCGDIFKKDRVTTQRGVELVKTPPCYIDENKHPFWRKRFMQLLKEKGLV